MLCEEDIKKLRKKITNIEDTELQELIFELINDNLNLQIENKIDPLTGLYNRKILEEIKLKYLPATMVMCDIDDFKRINDFYGHDAGDYVIKNVGQILKRNSRKNDFVCRFGGDEFLLIFVNIHDRDLVYKRCEKIRSEITENINLPNHNVTISIGIATNHNCDEFDEIIKRADEALYESKNAGKNQITFYSKI